MKSKICVKCQFVKVLEEFPKKNQRKDGYDTQCKECVNLLNRERCAKKKKEQFDWPSSKVCNACKNGKPLEEFPVDNSGKYGRKGRCSICCNQYQKSKYKYDSEWKNNKREKQNKQQRMRYKNDEDFREQKSVNKKIYSKTKHGRLKINAAGAKYLENNLQYKLKKRISSIMNNRLRKRLASKENKSTFDILPYNVEDLIEHLEKQFQPDMTWDNYGQWHIDHILPDKSFNYKSTSDKEFQKCWSLSNLQPLWAKDNLSKGSS